MRYLSVLICVLSLIQLHASSGYADLIEKTQPSIVNIQITRVTKAGVNDPFQFFFNNQRPFGPQREQESQGSGSGFLISADGYIVTNRHVVQDSKSMTVVLNDGKDYKAKLIGLDENLDIALLKIEAKNLKPLQLGNSDALRIGDEVLALGYPLQLGFTATSGILSGIGRDLRNDSLDLASYLQTDANITFGNSGGPLINSAGEVIGINTMIISQGSTFGFAIPSNLFRASVEQLKEHGAVRRGALGVNVRNLNENGRRYFKLEGGAEIAGVTPGMPGDKAGLKAGDIVVAIDGQAVKSSSDLIAIVSAHAPGDKIKLDLVDESGKRQKNVTLADRRSLSDPNFSDNEKGESKGEAISLGFSVASLDPSEYRQLGLAPEEKVVQIDQVEADSEADQQGLVEGMLLAQINGEDVKSPAQVRSKLDSIKKGETIRLKVLVPSRSARSIELRTSFIYLTKP